jgi:23S rRNA (uracil-5-)-methyltransferase RumA
MATPLCPYFGKCGGCSAQHIDYSLQLENKRRVVEHNTKHPEVLVFNDNEYYYRNRMDMIFHPGGLGFREKGKWHSIIDIERCAIANEKINEIIQEIRSSFRNIDAYDLIKQSGTFKQAVIRTDKTGVSVSFVLSETSSRLGEAVERIKEFSKVSKADNIAVTYIQAKSEVSVSDNYFMVKGTDQLVEEFLGKRFIYNIQGFFQNNPVMAGKMLLYVNELLEKYDTKDAHLLDLYSGVGIFGITNAGLFKEATMVESFKPAVKAAEANLTENQINNVRTYALDANKLRRLKFPSPLFVVTDPPRSGMDIKTIQQLNELAPQVIIYISCNPAQLGKEFPKLKKYGVKSAALFDLFPQTPHLEAVAELVL